MSIVISNQSLEVSQEVISKVTLCYGDITAQEVDVILAPHPFRAKTQSLLSAAVREKAGDLYATYVDNLMKDKKPGFSALISGGNLPCKKVAACLTPKWDGGFMGEDRALVRCFESGIRAAVEDGAQVIAVPVFLTGNHGYPKPRAVRLAIKAVFDNLDADKIQELRFVAFTKDIYDIFEERLERYGWEK
jgi:O-acetyl-ADP-ribose deacetylase (regulator of RNase III)